MKNTFFTILTIISGFAFAQQPPLKPALPIAPQPPTINRVNLQEKQNAMMKSTVETLLRAWANGDVNAYSPAKMGKPLSYASFLYHFGMPNMAYSYREAELNANCKRKRPGFIIDKYVLGCLQYEMDVITRTTFTRNPNEDKKTFPEMIRLVYTSTCDARKIEHIAVVFRASDLKKLDKKYPIYNPDNSAQSYTIDQLLTLNLYSSTEIGKLDNNQRPGPPGLGNRPDRMKFEEMRKKNMQEGNKQEN